MAGASILTGQYGGFPLIPFDDEKFGSCLHFFVYTPCKGMHCGGIVNLTIGALTQRSTRVSLLTSEVEGPNPSGPQHKSKKVENIFLLHVDGSPSGGDD